ncbi:MAG: hypothetical protein Q7R95_06625 [bacterium]|nr:hypothetical protein [bacterium]
MNKPNQEYKNLCSRCGKERVIVREWTEKIGTSVVSNVEKHCPDKECQKIIEKELRDKRKKRVDAEENRMKKIKERSMLKLKTKKVKSKRNF